MSCIPFWAILDERIPLAQGSDLLPADRGPRTYDGRHRSMTTLAATLPKQNLQARTTAGILNIVRIVGTGAFALAAVSPSTALVRAVPHTNKSPWS